MTPITPLHIAHSARRECASNASAGAGRIVKSASDTFGFRLAGNFQEILASEAQNISTASTPYDDLESVPRYPTINSQPIILGFSLPPYYFSCTASTKIVVNVFCKLVSFVGDNQAWNEYITRSTPVDSLAPVCDSWWFSPYSFNCVQRHSVNLKGYGRGTKPSTKTSSAHSVRLRAQISSRWVPIVLCVSTVTFSQALLESFPEPLIDCSGVPTGSLKFWQADIGGRSSTIRANPSNQDSEMSLVPLVPRLYNRPQGEMLQALCISLIPVYRGRSTDYQRLVYAIFSDLLTRKGVSRIALPGRPR